jgi:hypothetical protein
MSGKSDKLQSHKKKTEKKSGESRKYAQISYESVSVAAETNGISALSEDVRKQLAEDVSYRLREVIHVSYIQLLWYIAGTSQFLWLGCVTVQSCDC